MVDLRGVVIVYGERGVGVSRNLKQRRVKGNIDRFKCEQADKTKSQVIKSVTKSTLTVSKGRCGGVSSVGTGQTGV
jgi:hypothetical protein